MSKKRKQANPVDIKLKLHSEFEVQESYEHAYFGLSFYNFEILEYSHKIEEYQVIGEISIIKADFSEFNAFEVLDTSSQTESFMQLVNSDGLCSDVQEYLSRFDLNNIFIDHMFILNRIKLKEERRGRGISISAINAALRILNLDKFEANIFLKVFPLQYESIVTKENIKEFNQAKRKLVKFYHKIGFNKMPFKGNDIFMHINSSQLEL